MANDAEVIRQDTPVTPPGPEKGKGNETVTLTKAEHASLVRERDEAIQSERYWSRSRAGEKAAPVVEAEPEVETADLIPEITGDASVDEAIFSDPDKWAEAISKGPAAIKAFVKTMGLVTGAEVAEIAAKVAQRTVNLEKTRMQGDSLIIGEFPELNNPKSELFLATAEEVRAMVRLDQHAAKSPATLLAAARIAKLKLEAKAPRRGDPDEDDDRDTYDRVEREDDRRSRSDAQDTSRGRGRRESEDDSALGDQAKEVLRQMGGITDAEFLAERKKLGPPPRRRG